MILYSDVVFALVFIEAGAHVSSRNVRESIVFLCPALPFHEAIRAFDVATGWLLWFSLWPVLLFFQPSTVLECRRTVRGRGFVSVWRLAHDDHLPSERVQVSFS